MGNLWNSNQLLNQDLVGWKIAWCHYLNLGLESMAILPAEITETKEMVLVPEKTLLKKVWDRLPRQHAEVIDILTLFNPKMGVAFDLDDIGSDNVSGAVAMRVLSSEEIDELCKKEKPFNWIPVTLSHSDKPIEDPNFS